MTTKTQRNISGTIADLAFKYTAKGDEYAEVSLEEPGNKYPTKARAFNGDLVARFHNAQKGTLVGLAIEEEQGEYNGKPITYRNIVAIVPATTAPPPEVNVTGTVNWPAGFDLRGNSIERQVCLKGAVDLVSNGVLTPDENETALDLVHRAASSLLQWLQPEQTQETV